MSTQSLFSKKNIEAQQPDTRRGLLEELNLPPEVVSFIRKNARNLQICLISVVVLVLAWVFYDYYAALQENKGATLLASAMQAESPEQRVQLLENVTRDYSRTDAARWSKLELAHADYEAGRFDQAAAKYQEVLGKLSSGSSLAPLTRLNLAQSYEEAGQLDQALVQYDLLKKSTGFKKQALLALGRIHSSKGDLAAARKAYEELLPLLKDEPDPAIMSQVQEKLAVLGEDKKPAASEPEKAKE